MKEVAVAYLNITYYPDLGLQPGKTDDNHEHFSQKTKFKAF